MKNPNGPYPGRQLFIGSTPDGKPAFAYLVTGRSPASRERKATRKGKVIIMGPIGNQPYDPLRHYTAVRYDNEIGLLVVSNGIQTDAIFEMYRLLYHTGSAPEKAYAGTAMTGAKYEPDSLHTPRIAGVIANPAGGNEPAYILSIVTDAPPAKTYEVKPVPGTLSGVATYRGDMAKPEKFNVRGKLPVIKCRAETPGKLARYLYDLSEETNEGDDIRVCAVAGVRTGNEWKLAMINRHKE
jgi:IMP cyclohydrolase